MLELEEIIAMWAPGDLEMKKVNKMINVGAPCDTWDGKQSVILGYV